VTPPDGHPSDAELQSLGDGELAAADERRLRRHLEGCGACAARHRGLQLAGRRIGDWLRLLDHPAPAVDAETVARRAGGPLRPARPGLLAAAVATVLLAAVAAAAIVPGSPLRRFVASVLEEPSPAEAPPRQEPASRPPPASGVSFVPEPDLEVVFLRSQPEGAIRISLAETPEVRVRVVGGSAAYDLDPARLVVNNEGEDGTYEVRLPRDLPRVRVRIGDRVVFEKRGAAITGDFLERREAYVIPFGARAGAPPHDPGSGETPERQEDGRERSSR
jgi:anti-sigma factor RsiW